MNVHKLSLVTATPLPEPHSSKASVLFVVRGSRAGYEKNIMAEYQTEIQPTEMCPQHCSK